MSQLSQNDQANLGKGFVDEKQRQPHQPDTTNPPFSLALLPADLEALPTTPPTDTTKKLYIDEKQPVQADKETIRSLSYAQTATTEKEVGEPPVAPDGWHAPWNRPKIPGRICGVRTKLFWIWVAVIVVVFGLGIGLGMGLSNFDDDDDEEQRVVANVTSIVTSSAAGTSVLATATSPA